MKRVAILGGGISGLSAAWSLLKGAAPVQVTIYEASSRVGGWIRSGRNKGGGVFEFGPRSLRATGPAARFAMEVVSSVGLTNQVIPRTSKDPLKKYIYTKKHGLIESPSSLSWLYRIKPPFSRPLVVPVLKDLFTSRGSTDETVKDFFQRRFGNEMAKYVADPLCRGVYASSSESLSMQSCFPLFHDAEQTSGSVIRGMIKLRQDPIPSSACSLVKRASAEKWSMYSLRNGLGSLPEALHRYLLKKGVEVCLKQPCTKVDFREGDVMVESEGKVRQYDHVVSAVSSHVLSSLLGNSHSALTETLESIPSVTVAVVCLEYDGSDAVPSEYRTAFGYLVPSSESSKILGVVFDSSTFPELDRSDRPCTRLSVMLGGEWFESLFGSTGKVSEESIKKAALAELRDQLKITKQPTHAVSMIHKDCFPLYKVGHSAKTALSQSASLTTQAIRPGQTISFLSLCSEDCITKKIYDSI